MHALHGRVYAFTQSGVPQHRIRNNASATKTKPSPFMESPKGVCRSVGACRLVRHGDINTAVANNSANTNANTNTTSNTASNQRRFPYSDSTAGSAPAAPHPTTTVVKLSNAVLKAPVSSTSTAAATSTKAFTGDGRCRWADGVVFLA